MIRAPLMLALQVAFLTVALKPHQLSAQQSWQQESFPELGFSVRVPPRWQVVGRPSPGNSVFKIFKQVSPDLTDECLVIVGHHVGSNQMTQDQFDADLRSKFLGSPVPDNRTIGEMRRGLEQDLHSREPTAKLEIMTLDRLGGHPSVEYTYSGDGSGNAEGLKHFTLDNFLMTPKNAYEIRCTATSHNADAARGEFSTKINYEIVPFVASFVLQ